MDDTVAGSRVLLVDDDDALRCLYAGMLRGAGFEPVEAATGEDAVGLLDQNQFDVILTDINLPDKSGVDVLRAARRHDLDVPVILITGDPTVRTAVEALELGAIRYLTKPVSEAVILSAVAKAARLHQLARLRRLALGELAGDRVWASDRAGMESVYARMLGSLRAVYQPIFDVARDDVFAHEVLLRVSDPADSNPGHVLDVAERLGRIPELGEAVRQLCLTSAEVRGTLFVNVHPLELLDDRLYESASTVASAPRIVLEITERDRLDNIPDIDERVGELRGLGFRIAIDDLGSGYSGLNNFAALEPDFVKLDMALVHGVETAPIKRQLIRSMVQLCRELEIKVIAEGIETSEQRSVLVELGCEFLQGFLLGRPADQPVTR